MEQSAEIRVCHLADAAATAALGRELASLLLNGGGAASGAAPPTLLLQGELGAGKTCLVQGLALALGIDEPITSPTFALAQHYSGRGADGEPHALVHLDLYRLEQPAAAAELFAQEEEEAGALGAVLAVEWPERLPWLPDGAWRLELQYDGDRRRAVLRPPHSAA
ncbi:tRNA (adenosine(37)-N6)-threonylcarbamoyltransferase complex ATPase subunit type 1 TsaE [Synechococcus sp. MW101C3]|uniref:tRNA (adenosine(37)-N6)-threonylcarbamoyltransferase complex ATPase subunit type 1 TsaE n=1 Tax=Synechococcus sp. MW101C3 TaxID=210768 RepID=UPI000B9913F3|nr:tRNA (adenosine(37)-N6)-threonylcarbamoyltransferase complex ATPase subunit type 1 TsaE [Synechococcus sp. MW101C3]